MTGRPPRAPRASGVRLPVAVAEIVGSTAAAHVAAGGATPTTGHLLALTGAVALLATALRHHVVRLPVAVAGVLATQVGLHLAFAQAAGHLHPGPLLAGADTDMVLAHLGAAVVTALALAWQEQVLVRVVRRLVPDLAVSRVVAPRDIQLVAVPDRTLARRRILASAPRRGPPVVALA